MATTTTRPKTEDLPDGVCPLCYAKPEYIVANGSRDACCTACMVRWKSSIRTFSNATQDPTILQRFEVIDRDRALAAAKDKGARRKADANRKREATWARKKAEQDEAKCRDDLRRARAQQVIRIAELRAQQAYGPDALESVA